MGTGISWDVVTLNVKAEREVQTETVRVFVSGNLLTAGDDTSKAKVTISEALSKVIDGQWSLTTAHRGEDPSGMERVFIGANIRVKEHLTAGLSERLKQAGRAGLQLQLVRIDNRPPKAEMDAAFGELRQELYDKARHETDVLNRFLPAEEGKWRIGGIQFDEGMKEIGHSARHERLERLRYSSALAAAGQLDDASPDPDLPVGTRLVLQAKLQLKRLSIAFLGTGRPEKT